MVDEMEKELNNDKKEVQPTSNIPKVDEYVDRYFNLGESVESHNLSPEFTKSVKDAILERYQIIERLMKSPKNIEYAHRTLNGEPINLLELSPNIGYAIRYIVEGIRTQREANKSEIVKGLEVEVLEVLVKHIPSKYRNFPAELIDDFWTQPIRVDDLSGGRDFREKKSYILKKLAQYQKAEIKKNEILNIKSEIEEILNGNTTKEQESEKIPEIKESKIESIEKSPQVELNQKINLDPSTKRTSTQEVFGDSNGSYYGFIEHLKSRHLVGTNENSEPLWIGKDKRATFLGDILGDRTPEGEEIYVQLMKLRESARKEGGDIVWLAGNHDNMYNAVLFGFPSEKGVSVEQDMNNRLTSYVGNLEPAQHLPDTILTDYLEQDNMKTLIAKILNGDSEIDETIKKREKIYESIFKNKLTSTNQLIAESYKSSIDTLKSVVINFKSTFEDNSKTPQEKVKALINLGDGLPKYALVNLGNEILKNRDSILQNVREENPLLLEGIYQQKLVSVEDDVMNCHTNFTKNMMLMIEGQMTGGLHFKEGVEKINAYYQSILRWYGSPVPRTPEKLSDQHIAYFNNIRDEFISTSSESRINYSEDSRLSDDEKKQITLRLKQYGINAVLHGHNDEDGKVKGTDDVPILSIDRGAYKGSEGVSNRPTSTASINTSGVLSYF